MDRRLTKVLCGMIFASAVTLLYTAQTGPGRPKIGSPVRHQISLAGTFGELRADHFHTGMDIKSAHGQVGDSVFAVEDGYVQRMVVSGVGFGYGLYLAHPQGYTSVYGHLLRFRDDLADYAYQHQVKIKSWAINAYPGPDGFKIKKGEFIGFMGNSGSSEGPHLHFEMRRTGDSRVYDPWQFGLSYEDQIKPYVKNLTVYQSGKHTPVLARPVYGDLSADTLRLPPGEYALGIEAFDQMNGSSNRNGVQHIEVVVDGKRTYELVITDLAFSDNRYTNAIQDYQLRLTEKRYVYRLYNLPGNKFHGSRGYERQGFFMLPADGRLHQAEVAIKDAHGNTRRLHLNLMAEGLPTKGLLPTTGRIIRYDERFRYETDYLQVEIPPQTLYDHAPWSLMTFREHDPGIYSSVYQLMDDYIPLADRFIIRIKPLPFPETLKDKLYMAKCDARGESAYLGGEWDNGYLRARSKEFGNFMIMADTTAPTISITRFPLQWSGIPGVILTITDDVAGSRLTYKAYLGTTWIPMAYDAKNDQLFFDHKISFPGGEHEFRLIVEDERKNKVEFKRKITIL